MKSARQAWEDEINRLVEISNNQSFSQELREKAKEQAKNLQRRFATV